MPSTAAIKKQVRFDVAKVMEGPWGLDKKCPDEDECSLCATYHNTSTLVLIRNSYVGGMPCQYIPAAFEGVNSTINPNHIERHAWRSGWDKRRKKINSIVVNEDTMTVLLMRRFFDSQGVVSGTSADKSLENLMKLKGLGRETKVIEGNVSFNWEEKMTRDRENPGILELDDGVVDDDEVIEVEASVQN